MRKASLIATLALAAGTGAYLLWAYPLLPERVPMKWDMANRPVAFGTREAFVGIPAAITLLFAVLFPAITWSRPKAAWLGPLVLATLLFIVHSSTQAVLGLYPAVPLNWAVGAAFVALVGASGVAAVFDRIDARSSRVT